MLLGRISSDARLSGRVIATLREGLAAKVQCQLSHEPGQSQARSRLLCVLFCVCVVCALVCLSARAPPLREQKSAGACRVPRPPKRLNLPPNPPKP